MNVPFSSSRSSLDIANGFKQEVMNLEFNLQNLQGRHSRRKIAWREIAVSACNSVVVRRLAVVVTEK